MNKLSFLSKNVELSEQSSNDNLVAKFCLCDFSVNGNGVKLNRDSIDSWLGTLVNQPLVGRIGYTGDFTGHNMRIGQFVDANGETREEVMFDTEAIGTFTSVGIETQDNVDYIVGSAEIWSRYPTVCELIKKRVADGELHTSWEIIVSEAHEDAGVKVIDNGRFTALCVLGKNVTPAFANSRLLEVAEDISDTELADALTHDISVSEGDKEMTDEKIVVSEEQEVVEPAEEVSEVVEDTNEALAEQDKTDVSEEKPEKEEEEKETEEAECKKDDEESECKCEPEEEKEETAEVECKPEDKEDDSADKEEHEKSELEIAEATIAELRSAIADAATRIAELEAKVAELTPYKEAADKAAAEKAEIEKAEKTEALKAYAVKSGLISSEELDSNEAIKAMISELDENGIKQIIAERFMDGVSAKTTVEVSTVNEEVGAMNLYDGDSDADVNIISAYLNKK